MAMYPFNQLEEDDSEMMDDAPDLPDYGDSIRGIGEYQPAPTKLADLAPAGDKAVAGATPDQGPKKPLTPQEQLMADYLKLSETSPEELKKARDRDRMLKIGGSIGDALATYLNAQGQMNVKAPGVQVQQGAGLGKVADMFATAPEIASNIKDRREAMIKQYAELSKSQRAQDQLKAQKQMAKDSADLQRELLSSRLTSEEKIAAIRAAEPTFEEKEDIKARKKEEIQVNKENRAVKEKLQPAISTLESQIKNIDNALDLFTNKKTGEIKTGLTGPIQQYFSPITKEGQKIENALNKISLSEMTKTFAGMSKAVDSDAERAFFQAAQPSLKKYEDVNVEVLKEMKRNLESLRDKSQAKLQEIEAPKQNIEVQNYADQYFNGDYNKAFQFLKKRGDI